MNRRSRKIKRVLKYIALFLIPVIVFLGVTFGVEYYISLSNEKKAGVTEEPKNSSEPIVSPTPSVEPYINELPNARSTYGNDNIMGKIEIPNMNINDYVARTNNNSFYLNYNLYNQLDYIGMPFFDYRNDDLANEKQINIYGHNTQNEKIYDKLPFVSLEQYTNQDVFNNNKDIYLYLDEKKVHYEIFAIKIVTDNTHMKVKFSSDSEFVNHTNTLLSGSLYRDNTTIKGSDRLLVIQICHYDPVGSYLLVIAKEV